MIKITFRISRTTGQEVIVYRCPECSSYANGSQTVCSSCYRQLPDVRRLDNSSFRRLSYHITHELSKITPASIICMKPTYNVNEILNDWLSKTGNKMMEQ